MASGESGHEHGGDEAGPAQTEDEARTAMGMASDAELDALAQATGESADCLFLQLMIRHHEGSVPMAEAVLDLGSEPRVLLVAETIRVGQTAEIAAMQSMQERLGCTP
jgi:uncharacterized protein (DUF305 family)